MRVVPPAAGGSWDSYDLKFIRLWGWCPKCGPGHRLWSGCWRAGDGAHGLDCDNCHTCWFPEMLEAIRPKQMEMF